MGWTLNPHFFCVARTVLPLPPRARGTMAFPPVASRPLLAITIALLAPILLYVLVAHIAGPRAAECAKRDGVISTTPPGCHMIGGQGCPRKLRVALLFSGQPRHVDGIAYEAYSRCVLDRGFAVDVFAFFWRDGGGDGVDASSIADFARLYHPVAVETAPPIPPEVYLRGRTYPRQYDYPATRDKTMKNHMSMYTAMANVFSLWRNVSAALGREYDILIRARSDGVWAACPDLGRLDPDYLYGPNWYPGLPNLVNHILVLPGRDAAAPGSIADTVFNIRDAIDEMYNEGVFFRGRESHVCPRGQERLQESNTTDWGVAVRPRDHAGRDDSARRGPLREKRAGGRPGASGRLPHDHPHCLKKSLPEVRPRAVAAGTTSTTCGPSQEALGGSPGRAARWAVGVAVAAGFLVVTVAGSDRRMGERKMRPGWA